MPTKTQCNFMLTLMLAMVAPTLLGCRSARQFWPWAQQNPTSLRDRQAIQSPETSSFAGTGHSPNASSPRALLPSLDAVDSLVKPDVTAQVLSLVTPDQTPARPASNSLVDAFETQIQPANVERLSDNELDPFTPAAFSQTSPTRETQVGPTNASPLQAQASTPPIAALEQQATTAEMSPTVRLVLVGVRPGDGDVKVAIFTDGSNFPQPTGASQTFSLPASQPTLEQGLNLNSPFAVAVYQDINDDGELSRSRLGVPVEPFAFSNNAMGQRGPPTFQQATVVNPSSATKPVIVTINLP